MIFGEIFLVIAALSLYAISLLSIKVIKRVSFVSLIIAIVFIAIVLIDSMLDSSASNRQAGFLFFVPGLFFLALSLILFLIAFIKGKSGKNS